MVEVDAVTGGTAPYTYVWSNGSSDSVNAGIGAGNYYVTVTDNHACSVSLEESISCTDGIEAYKADAMFDVYPNPASETINGSGAFTNGTTVCIRSSDGRTVKAATVVSGNAFSIDIGNLAQGLYLVELRNGQATTIRRFVKL